MSIQAVAVQTQRFRCNLFCGTSMGFFLSSKVGTLMLASTLFTLQQDKHLAINIFGSFSAAHGVLISFWFLVSLEQ